ncbi:MAG: AmmeMemoRadiSam system protein B [Chloroflexota bacterium]|nr:AmmeMemoRadiSam system protein B [Chloroflexota bacterium]
MSADATQVREPVVAGSFYPGSAKDLASSIDGLLADVDPASDQRPTQHRALRGIVVPHAGYVYSGPIAATAYALLAAQGPHPRRIVILGPSHFEPLRGWAVPTHRAWRTPLGEVLLDDTTRRITLDGGAVADDDPHRSEHSLEVQLPFIQRVCPGVPVLPIAVGRYPHKREVDLLTSIMTEDAVLVVSTDLSHYHDADTARRLDSRTAAAVVALDDASLDSESACGCDALRLSIAWARGSGLDARLLDLRSSADTAGDPDRVVGYGAFAIERSDTA